ncbi:hypothetical protein TWF718_001382 [Orbilia javanica]|uniref:F-box domain-containing protein n=1 Tax=Orbilia javanica TaxID=47235 RepID=A0AAN8MYR6_9PEZI
MATRTRARGIPLPTELVDLIIQLLPSRRDIWSLCLVCRKLNLVATSHLYKTVILELPDDVSIAPSWKKARYLLLNPQHSKAHLVRELGIVTESQKDRLFANLGNYKKSECASMANELLTSFVRHLKIGQLRTFIWRCNFAMSPALLGLLALCHPQIQYLYLQNISIKPELREWTKSVIKMFSSLKGFSWHGICYPDEVKMAFDILKASAPSLETFGITIDPLRALYGLGSEPVVHYDANGNRYLLPNHSSRTKRIFEDHDDSLRLQDISFPSLVEYQTSGTDLFLHKSLPLSQIQRLCLTEAVDKENLENLLLSFSGLVEINVVYQLSPPSVAAITHHGETLRILSVCSSDDRYNSQTTWSTTNLKKLGSKCPNIVELGMHMPQLHEAESRRGRSRNSRGTTRGQSQSQAGTITHGAHSTSTTIPTVFPRHLFQNLELLYISTPDPRYHSNSLFRSNNSIDPPFGKRTLRDIVECLNGYGFCGLYAGGPAPSRKLKVVTLGVGKLEVNAGLNLNPMILKTVYPFPTGDVVTLSPYDMRALQGDGDLAGWKLLRRYPSLIPTKGL